jgi:hypothetical protein
VVEPAQHAGLYAWAIGFGALLGSYIYYLLVEKTLLRFFRRRTPR